MQEPWAAHIYYVVSKAVCIPCRGITGMLLGSVCIAFKTPVQEPWAACIHVMNSKARCSLQRGYRNAAAPKVQGTKYEGRLLSAIDKAQSTMHNRRCTIHNPKKKNAKINLRSTTDKAQSTMHNRQCTHRRFQARVKITYKL